MHPIRGARETSVAYTARRLIQRLGETAKMPFPIHPHMLRHACGFKLANDGHDTRALQHYLGHKNIQHTVRYTEMAPDRFKDIGGLRSRARRQWRLALSWLALQRANRSVGLSHQPVRPAHRRLEH